MALTSPLQEWRIKKFVGMNNKIEDNELSVEHSILTQNGRYENEPGALVKRDVVSYYNTTMMNDPTEYPTNSIFRLYTSTGDTKLLAQNYTTMFVGDDISGSMTAIRENLTEGKPMSFIVYSDLCIMSNGYDNPFVYDGSADNLTWELGACKAKVGSGAGITRTDISYKVTIDADAYVCDAVSNSIASLTNEDVDLSHIPVGPTGTVNRKIYRKSSETGGSYKLVTTIADNTTTTYTDTNNDVSLGAAMPAVTDAIPHGRLLQIHRERLFISGDPSNPNTIYYSNVYLPHYIQHITNNRFLEVAPDDGDEIQGIPISLGVMICIKRNTIRKIHVTTATSGSDPNSWYADDPVQYIGCPAWMTITESPYGIFFLGWDSWYLFDGNKSTPVIDEFDVAEILETNFDQVVAHFHEGILYAAFTDISTGEQYNDKQMVYNWKRQAMSMDNLHISSYASFSGRDDYDELFYGDSRKGFVYFAYGKNRTLRYKTKTQLEETTRDDIFIGGTENNPFMEIGRDVTIDGLTVANGQCWNGLGTEGENVGATPGTIDDLKGTINMVDTDGEATFPSVQLNVGQFGQIHWNLRRFHETDTVTFFIRAGSTQALCEAATWKPVAGYTDPNGSDITTSDMDESGKAPPYTWVQIKVEMTANSTGGSPRLYNTNGFVIKMTYTKAGTDAEDAVEFIHEVGYRNFDAPFVDKIFKKFISNHEGDEGAFTITWTTENATGTFDVDLATFQSRWESFFPSTAMGRKLNVMIYKNDLFDFKIKEFMGLYTPEPIIV